MTAWPSLIIRCDAGGDHGLGHLMRCLALAEALRSAGGPVAHFIMQAPEIIGHWVNAAGFTFDLTASQAGADSAALAVRLQALSVCPWFVLDGKYVTAEQTVALSAVSHLICYDDSPYRELSAAVIVNAQPWTKTSDYAAVPGRLILAGASYNAINPAYFAAAERTDRQGILITLGGEDPANDTAWIAENLGDLLAGYPVLAVIGPAHPAPQQACCALARFVPQAEIIQAPPSLIAAAERSFLALSAGGTSCYELQAAGLAVAALAVEEHQVPFVDALCDLGGVVSLGGPLPRDVATARAAVTQLLQDTPWRNERIACGRALFSAPGAAFLAQTLMEHLR